MRYPSPLLGAAHCTYVALPSNSDQVSFGFSANEAALGLSIIDRSDAEGSPFLSGAPQTYTFRPLNKCQVVSGEVVQARWSEEGRETTFGAGVERHRSVDKCPYGLGVSKFASRGAALAEVAVSAT